MNDETLHPARDPALAEALRSLGEEPPMDEVDWSALRRSVNDRAELPLARLRSSRRAAEETSVPVVPVPMAPPRRRAGWLRSALPLAAAAGIGALAWLGDLPLPGRDPAPIAEATLTVEDVLQPELSDGEFHLFVTGRANPDELLLLALD